MPNALTGVPHAPLAGDGLPVSCPACPAKVRLPAEGIGVCSGCGSGLLAVSERILPVRALGARIEAADLPRVVAASLRARKAPRHARLTALVLVPAFTVRYEVRGRLFHAIVEACSGRVLADLHPHPLTVRVHVAMAAVLAVDVAAFALVASLAPNNLIRPVFVMALGALVYAFTAFAFRLRERGRPA